MTALARLFRTTVFKISLAYLVISAIGAGLVLDSVGDNVKMLIDQQTAQTVEADIGGLSEQYAQGGIRRLVQSVETRAQRPGADLYLVTTPAGEPIAGNIASLPPGVLERPGSCRDQLSNRRAAAGKQRRATARIFALPGGFHLLVGHDLEEGDRLRHILGHALLTSLALACRHRHAWRPLGCAAGAQSRRVRSTPTPEESSPATFRAGCLSPEPETNSTGWCKTSTPCSIASANSWPASNRSPTISRMI